MSSRLPSPVAELDTRMPRAGKIKLGMKTGNSFKKLKEFRFMSPHKDCIEKLAEMYGGEVKPLHDERASPKDQFEVCTNVAAIEVYLIPDGYSTWYEKWGGGGIQRRCDGEECEIQVSNGDDYDSIMNPCLCLAEEAMSCDAKTRLVVILPNVPMRGAWLLETKSWNAAMELPGMHRMITSLAPGGFVRATLGIEQREVLRVGKKRQFVVPVLTMAESAMELQAGLAGVAAIGAGAAANLASQGVATPALGPGTPVTVSSRAQDDDDIVDAEEVDAEMLDLEDKLRHDGEHFGLDPERFLSAMLTTARTPVKGVDQTLDDVKKRLKKARAEMASGKLEPIGISGEGKIQWAK